MKSQDNNIEEFDNYVRDMLLNAEAGVAEGSWENISGRIERKKALPFWILACGLASAAASIALFLSPAHHTEVNIPSLLSEVPVLKTASTLSWESISAPRIIRNEERLLLSMATETAQAPLPDETGTVSDGQAQRKTETKEQCQEEEAYAKAFEDDATLWWEDDSEPEVHGKKSMRMTGISLGGNLISTESNAFSVNRFSTMRSPDYMPDETTILEDSKSSYSIPLTLGMGVNLRLTDRLGIETGLDYSRLSRDFEGTFVNYGNNNVPESISVNVNHIMEYVGIPLSLSFCFLEHDSMSLYTRAGVEAEYCISNNYKLSNGDYKGTWSTPVNGLQWSAGVSLGSSFRLADFIDLYVDPSLRYYFDCNHPKNIRTDRRFIFGFNAGLRFNI